MTDIPTAPISIRRFSLPRPSLPRIGAGVSFDELPGSFAMPSIWPAWRPTQAAGNRRSLSMTTSKAVIQFGERPKPYVEHVFAEQ